MLRCCRRRRRRRRPCRRHSQGTGTVMAWHAQSIQTNTDRILPCVPVDPRRVSSVDNARPRALYFIFPSSIWLWLWLCSGSALALLWLWLRLPSSLLFPPPPPLPPAVLPPPRGLIRRIIINALLPPPSAYRRRPSQIRAPSPQTLRGASPRPRAPPALAHGARCRSQVPAPARSYGAQTQRRLHPERGGRRRRGWTVAAPELVALVSQGSVAEPKLCMQAVEREA